MVSWSIRKIVTNCYNLDLFYVGGGWYNIDNNKNGGWLATPNSKEANWRTSLSVRSSSPRSQAFLER